MKIEPPINHPALLQQINAEYVIDATLLTFVPKGELSIAYVLDCADGSRYFAKLLPHSRQAQGFRDNLDLYLAITTELYSRQLLTSVVAPLPTADGRLRSAFEGMPLILFPYVTGNNLPEDSSTWPAQVRDQLARDVAALHLATNQLHSPLPASSAFDIAFVVELERDLAALDNIGPHHRQSQQQLRDLLLPYRPALADHIAHLFGLHQIVVNKQPELVLCHTDIHELNLIVDAQGNAHILDWEGISLAPAEHDLQAFTASHLAHFLQVYWRAGGIKQIDLAQFAFYNYRRYLADLYDWLIRILYENNDPAQDEYDLAAIQIYSLDKLVTAEDTLAQIAAGIRAAGTAPPPAPPTRRGEH